ncbi:hypothetical protein ACCUM_2934 [Candidatus Accumulibacter phosphatis]|uniref:Uncharacterized protein n=1 Tax=Candidatus Accumulibacter phosphatis TaxID=327160 RepID=A0A5S4EQI3_9PROT|nr:hypothetical protein ACCUM_2934 [Candidatus Accumulibacter phosphatis]
MATARRNGKISTTMVNKPTCAKADTTKADHKREWADSSIDLL